MSDFSLQFGEFLHFQLCLLPIAATHRLSLALQASESYSPCPDSLFVKRKISVERKKEGREEGKGEEKRKEEGERVASREGETAASDL